MKSSPRYRLVYVGSSISSFGFRLIAAMVRRDFPDVGVHFVVTDNIRDIWTVLTSNYISSLTESDIDRICDHLADADLVGISSMSESAELVKRLIAGMRRRNPQAYIVWGGIHPTIDPDDAIQAPDAICIGEGENCFPELLRRHSCGEDFTDIGNFWFRLPDGIRKNPFLPLVTSEEMDALPHPVYGEGETCFVPGAPAFLPLTDKDYLRFESLSYNTIWSRGCPFKCTYCANTRFLDMDKNYGRLRHASVDHVIDEVAKAIKRFPFISFVTFLDDCMIALPDEVLREFSRKWRARIELPFIVQGFTPAHMRAERLEILLSGGLNRVRMGIQSGSDRILKFYRRPNRPGLLQEATGAIGRYSGQMMPPTYDMIFDNPYEIAEDVRTTLEFLYNLPRPYTINILSLRNMPNTELNNQIMELGLDVDGMEVTYTKVRSTFANALVPLIVTFKIPRGIFHRLLPYAKSYTEGESWVWRPLIMLFRILFLIKRAYHHLAWWDFSVAFGGIGHALWRHGLLDRLKRQPNKAANLLPRGGPGRAP